MPSAAKCWKERVVLSNASLGILPVYLPSSLLSSLTHAGVVTSPVGSPLELPMPMTPVANTGTSSPWTKLSTDIRSLITELQSLAAKSGLTVSDLQSLTSDSQSIAQAGFYFNSQTLNPVISELATAVAGGSSITQPDSDFSALFSGSGVSASVIATTSSDVVKAIQDSNVTPTDLKTVAGDEAAIRPTWRACREG